MASNANKRKTKAWQCQLSARARHSPGTIFSGTALGIARYCSTPYLRIRQHLEGSYQVLLALKFEYFPLLHHECAHYYGLLRFHEIVETGHIFLPRPRAFVRYSLLYSPDIPHIPTTVVYPRVPTTKTWFTTAQLHLHRIADACAVCSYVRCVRRSSRLPYFPSCGKYAGVKRLPTLVCPVLPVSCGNAQTTQGADPVSLQGPEDLTTPFTQQASPPRPAAAPNLRHPGPPHRLHSIGQLQRARSKKGGKGCGEAQNTKYIALANHVASYSK